MPTEFRPCFVEWFGHRLDPGKRRLQSAFSVFVQRDFLQTSCVFPREVNATIGELHAADLVVEGGSHEYDFDRVNGSAPFDVDNVKPKILQKKARNKEEKGVRHGCVQRENV